MTTSVKDFQYGDWRMDMRMCIASLIEMSIAALLIGMHRNAGTRVHERGSASTTSGTRWAI